MKDFVLKRMRLTSQWRSASLGTGFCLKSWPLILYRIFKNELRFGLCALHDPTRVLGANIAQSRRKNKETPMVSVRSAATFNFTHPHTPTHTNTHTRARAHTHSNTHIDTKTDTHTQTNTADTHTYIHTHTHTHTHKQQ